MIPGSLRGRVVVFFAILLTLVLSLVFALVTQASLRIARQHNEHELIVGERVFQRLLGTNREQLIQAAGVLAADFGFRRATASHDSETIESALENHAQRIGADLMMLAGLDHRLLASTMESEYPGGVSPVADLIAVAEAHGYASAIKLIGDTPYQVVIVPVLAPQPIAWVAVGFVIDDGLARELQALTGLDPSFLMERSDGSWRMLASTQPPQLAHALQASLRRTGIDSVVHVVSNHATLTSSLGTQNGRRIVAVLQRSVDEAVARFLPLRTMLLWLAVGSLVFAVGGSYLIARNITHPLSELAASARRVQQGDYSKQALLRSPDEIAALSASFDHMREGIAARESEIRRLAYEDGLTGLPNREMFNDRLERIAILSQRTGAPFSVLMIDLDRFKYINDTLGHEAGDQVLIDVGQRLNGLLRDSDTVARLGGDEFAVLLATINPERLIRAVTRIRACLEQPIVVASQPVDVTGSIGIASYPQHGTDASTLLRHADIAMYTAKRTRSGFATYDSSYDEHRQEHLNLLSELRRAVDDNQLALLYQPKLSLAGSGVAGVEALVRWRHPERGTVPPNEFIPFAEHTGAIRMLTRWVVEHAVAQCAEWLTDGLSLKVSVNISARDLLDQQLPEILQSALAHHRVPAKLICLEITESALMEDPVKARDVVDRLRRLGVEFAIDDYGTGYSSLAYMSQLPVNELKIDRAFVTAMAEFRRDYAIVRSTIELGHNLGLRVVAEGVETAAEQSILNDLGCDEVQGYHICHPLPAESLELWLTDAVPGLPEMVPI